MILAGDWAWVRIYLPSCIKMKTLLMRSKFFGLSRKVGYRVSTRSADLPRPISVHFVRK